MNCGLCGRRQADGLLSRGSWGHVSHEKGELHACPTCKVSEDWEQRLQTGAGGTTSTSVSAYGSGYAPPAYGRS